jgi:selenocysteine-specific elongation factor
MGHATVGVIGHVNHGKTSLVKALTGTDTDRLDEEKRRGMSIVLGFAYLALADGTLDLVDVPGHEQFVRTMVAGATGVQASLLVVNAREGVKPQTREHVAIADLVGVRRGVVAITKADLVDAHEREDALQRVRRFLRGTHLEFAPLVFTSVQTGEGLDALRQALSSVLAAAAEPVAAGRHFWLPVDRVFTLPGHGTIATGTLRGGPLRVGDALACMPHGVASTVRQLQVHNEVVTEARPGQRVGVNLRQLGTDAIARGAVLAPPARLQPGSLLDVELRLLAPWQPPQLDGRRMRLLFGTTEVAAVVRVLDRLAANESRVLAQLRCARPVVAVDGESFILRSESPAATVGGGRILQAAARRHARGEAAALAHLRILAGGSARQLLEAKLKAAGLQGCLVAELAADARLQPALLARAIQEIALTSGQRAWHRAALEQARQRVLDALRAFHAAHPMKPWGPLTVCRGALPAAAGETLYRAVLQALEAERLIVLQPGRARLAGHDPLQQLAPQDREALRALADALREGGMNPPDPPPPADPRARALLELLVAAGDVLLLPGQPPTQRVAFHREALERARGALLAAFPPPTPFTVSKARELLGSTRKFTVPLLEHLHANGDTQRRGDLHLFALSRSPGGE